MSKPRTPALPIQLDQVLNKYWELANLDPEITRGSITGQLKALDALAAELSAANGTPRAPRPTGVYRAAWLADAEPVETGREN